MNKKDEMLFEQLYILHYPDIYKYLLYKTASSEDAEELAQEVFSVLVAKWHTLSPQTSNYKNWLYTVSNNKLKEYYRKKHRAPVLTDINDNLVPYTVDFDDEITDITEENIMLKIKAGLNGKDKTLFEYAYEKRYTNPQLCRIYSASIPVIKMRKNRLKIKVLKIIKSLTEGEKP